MARARKRKNIDRAEDPDLPPSKKHAPSPPLPNGVNHYQSIDDVPHDLQKYVPKSRGNDTAKRLNRYWHQGYSIFSKYDEGIWMTDQAWYGVTHESVATYVVFRASQAATNSPQPHRPAYGGGSASQQVHHRRRLLRRGWKHHRVRAVWKVEAGLRNREGCRDAGLCQTQCRDLRGG